MTAILEARFRIRLTRTRIVQAEEKSAAPPQPAHGNEEGEYSPNVDPSFTDGRDMAGVSPKVLGLMALAAAFFFGLAYWINSFGRIPEGEFKRDEL